MILETCIAAFTFTFTMIPFCKTVLASPNNCQICEALNKESTQEVEILCHHCRIEEKVREKKLFYQRSKNLSAVSLDAEDVDPEPQTPTFDPHNSALVLKLESHPQLEPVTQAPHPEVDPIVLHSTHTATALVSAIAVSASAEASEFQDFLTGQVQTWKINQEGGFAEARNAYLKLFRQNKTMSLCYLDVIEYLNSSASKMITEFEHSLQAMENSGIQVQLGKKAGAGHWEARSSADNDKKDTKWITIEPGKTLIVAKAPEQASLGSSAVIRLNDSNPALSRVQLIAVVLPKYHSLVMVDLASMRGSYFEIDSSDSPHPDDDPARPSYQSYHSFTDKLTHGIFILNSGNSGSVHFGKFLTLQEMKDDSRTQVESESIRFRWVNKSARTANRNLNLSFSQIFELLEPTQ
jgi:hypothetical protein